MAIKDIDNLELARRACSHLEKRYSDVQSQPGDQYEPFNYRPFLDLLAEDAVFAAPCSPGTPVYGSEFRGKPAIVKLFLEDDPNLVESNGLRVEKRPEYFINADGDRVVIVTAYTYKIRKTGMVARNKDIALVLDFKDGKITRAVEIQDLSEWAEAYPRGSAQGSGASA